MRELLPDWLLSPAYALRRAFLPRHGAFRLRRDESGCFRLSPDAARLPHGRVLLRPLGWPGWESLEIEGTVRVSGSSVRWSRWLDPPAGGESPEIDLPYGLEDLTARLLPDPRGVGELSLELDELGVIRTARAALAEGTSTVLREVLRPADDGGVGSTFGRLSWTVRESIDLASYSRWLRMFETPSAVAHERVRARALRSGLRVSIVAGEGVDGEGLQDQLPGQVEIVRSFGDVRGDIVVPLGTGVRPVPHALATLVFAVPSAPGRRDDSRRP